ncbi:MarR family transcriptional regulator [Sphingomonas humi]|uniref:HTH marR-type domain-containing protein n=1 Tax=Sphingomonas humi TaxID=335630 RepID=A0ABP7RTH9_9SPHN
MSFINKPPTYASEEPLTQAVMTLSPEEAALARTMLAKLLDNAPAGGDTIMADAPTASVVRLARSILQSRRRRAEHFGPVLFSEPAWEMLLTLFVYADGGERMSVTRLAEFVGTPLTTAIRWLDYLESQRLIERRQCENDRRKFLVELSGKGRSMLHAYFENLLTTLPPLSDIVTRD